MIHVIDPFAQANATWLGLGDDGHRRNVFKVVDQHVNASELLVEPGEPGSRPAPAHRHGPRTAVAFIYGPHGNLSE